MRNFSGISFLNRLARLYGLQTAYDDVHNQRQQASTESLLALLKSLGAPIANYSGCACGISGTATGNMAKIAGACSRGLERQATHNSCAASCQ